MSELQAALTAAQKLSPLYGGMADVMVRYNPYECLWKAEASWSGGKKFEVSQEAPEEALRALTQVLCNERT